MTCIVGMEHDNKVYMCGDSAGSSGWNIRHLVQPKVFRTGEFLIGSTGSIRMHQLLQYRLSIRPQEKETDYAYMVSEVSEAVRKLLKEHGNAHVENNQEEGGVFLIGYRGKLYVMQSDFSVLRHGDSFDAAGCGQSYAMGALAAINEEKPQVALTRALEIAERFSNGVRGPFHCEVLE